MLVDLTASTSQNSASHLQSQIPQIQQSYADLSATISSTANELSSIVVNQNLPLQEKGGRVGKDRLTTTMMEFEMERSEHTLQSTSLPQRSVFHRPSLPS